MNAEEWRKLLTEGAKLFNEFAGDDSLVTAMASGKSPDDFSDAQKTKFDRMLDIFKKIDPKFGKN